MEKSSLSLATLRLVLFALLSASCFNALPLSTGIQILLSSGVIISDILDGKLSREKNSEENKVKFRKIDTFVDKVGLLSCTIGLCMTGKLPLHLFASIFSYNAIIVVGGLAKTKQDKNLTEHKISGNVFSRSANLLTAATFLLANNNLLITSLVQNLISITLISSFGISLANHYNLIKKNKYEKILTDKNESVNTIDVFYENDTEESVTIEQNKNYNNQSLQNLINDLKWFRNEIDIEKSVNLSNSEKQNAEDKQSSKNNQKIIKPNLKN